MLTTGMQDSIFRLKPHHAYRFLGTICVCLGLSLPFSFYRMIQLGPVLGNLSHFLAFAFLSLLYLFRTRFSPDRLFLATMGMSMVALPVGFVQLGMLSVNLLLLPFVPILLRIGYGKKAAWFGIGYMTLVIGIFAFLFTSHRLIVAVDPVSYVYAPSSWLYSLSSLILATLLFVVLYTPAEVTVMEKQAWFNAIFDGVSDALFIRDAQTGEIIDVNQRVSEMFGYTRDEVLDKPLGFLSAGTPPYTRDGIAEKFQQALREGFSTLDWHVRRKDGSLLWVDGDMKRVRIGERDVVIIALRDITARKAVEEALRESEDKYRQVFEMESDALFLIDKETGRILEVNSAACTLYGYTREELLLKRNTDLSAEPEKTTHQTKIEGTVIPVRHHRKADGTVIPVEITAGHFTLGGRRVHLAAIRDISFRFKLEEQLQQAQKMESIGRLAGGIAHDFNNMLSPIIGFSDLLLKSPPTDERHREWLESIQKSASRARDLTQQLLAFSRKQVLVLKPISLEIVLRDMERILRRTIREDIRIEVSIQPRVGIVRADVGQLEQILMNLALNAQDAMPKGGTLRLGLDETMYRPVGPEAPADTAPSPHVMLSVSDSGCGMEKAVLQHLFEPFFTTKERGKGTGLGLSMVYGIVRQHGGYIQAESTPGEGTTFIIYLPVLADVSVQESETRPGPEPVAGGNETILVVEDDEMVRSMIRLILQRQGYKVHTASNGPECLELVGRLADRIDLLLTDVIMPGMNGRELYDQLSKRISPLRAMFISGYDSNVIARHGILDAELHFLQKPFTPDQLCAKVREAIEAGGSGKKAG
ncbi:MAG TPA: PAS domain S-box protein [Candidatus Ozemobacteraceae bacterium]